MMSSPQSSSTITSEERAGTLLDSSALDPRSVMFKIKQFSAFASLHSKINFIHTCLLISFIPVGFFLKWSEQTGFNKSSLSDGVKAILQSTSLKLMEAVLFQSIQQFMILKLKLISWRRILPAEDWTKALRNYQFIFNISSQKLSKKLSKFDESATIDVILPFQNLNNESSVDADFTSSPSLSTMLLSLPSVSSPSTIPLPLPYLTSPTSTSLCSVSSLVASTTPPSPGTVMSTTSSLPSLQSSGSAECQSISCVPPPSLSSYSPPANASSIDNIIPCHIPSPQQYIPSPRKTRSSSRRVTTSLLPLPLQYLLYTLQQLPLRGLKIPTPYSLLLI